jgi:hypothetical protein
MVVSIGSVELFENRGAEAESTLYILRFRTRYRKLREVPRRLRAIGRPEFEEQSSAEVGAAAKRGAEVQGVGTRLHRDLPMIWFAAEAQI